MKRRFIVSVSGLSDAEVETLRSFLKSKAAWWNWIPNFWLLTTKNEEVSCAEIRDKIMQIADDPTCLVMEVPKDEGWATYGPSNKNGKKMSDWIKETWGDED